RAGGHRHHHPAGRGEGTSPRVEAGWPGGAAGCRVTSVDVITGDDLPRVLPLLRAHDPRQSDEAWSRLLRPPWAAEDTPSGWVLLDGETPVGVLGAVFSERRVGGATRRF